MSTSLQPHGLYPTGLLHPWNFLGKSTGVDCHFLLQGIFLTQGSNPSPELQADALPSEPPWNPKKTKDLYIENYDTHERNQRWYKHIVLYINRDTYKNMIYNSEMERYIMFLDWKTQYCENDYTTQSNLHIQCNPYQITNGIFSQN